MTADDYVKSLLCLLAWREERSNQANGCLGVLFVVRNRVNAGWGNWTQVISKHGQFSSISIVGDSQTVEYPDVRDPLFQILLQRVDGIYEGVAPDNLVDGALYYADLQSPGFDKNGWFANTILKNPDKYPRLAQVGTTTYFGERNAS
jgi:hypothetical protein